MTGNEALRPLAEAIAGLYDNAADRWQFVDAVAGDEPRRALIRLANRVVARDHGLGAASALLQAAACALDAA